MGWSEQGLSFLLLVLSAGICSHITYGTGTKKARELFAFLVLGIVICIQMFYLVHAVTYVPATRFFVWKNAIHRDDCIASSKGGKRSANNTAYEDMNPCFCHGANAQCHTTIKYSTKVYDLNIEKCPTDGTAKCVQGLRHEDRIHRWVPSLRDCRGGQLTRCTKDQPCTPCERSSLPLFKQGRCKSCSSINNGDCRFVPDVGPYCLVSPTSKEIEPCRQCCTEPEPLFDSTGFCW